MTKTNALRLLAAASLFALTTGCAAQQHGSGAQIAASVPAVPALPTHVTEQIDSGEGYIPPAAIETAEGHNFTPTVSADAMPPRIQEVFQCWRCQ